MSERTQYLVRLLLVAAIAGLLCFAEAEAKKPPTLDGPSYDIVKLDDMNGLFEGFAYDINESRLIVGDVLDSISGEETVARAAYWTVIQTRRSVESTLHFLDDGGFTSTGATNCNNQGEIVGQALGTPLYWATPESGPLALPLPDGSLLGVARAISNDGVICGSTDGKSAAIVWRVTEAGIWGPLVLESDPDAEHPIEARAISDQMDGVVTVVGDSNGRAVTWTVTLTEDGELVHNSTSILSNNAGASGMNNLGMVCGQALYDAVEAVVWIDGIPRILEWETPPMYAGVPYDINDAGVVVGRSWGSAVVWSSPEASMVRLDKYLKNTSSLDSLTSAKAVSESGEIVGYGWISDTRSDAAFLAIPK